MTKENKKKKKKKRKFSIIRFILLIILLAIFIGAGAVAGIVVASIRSAPKIDPTIISELLNESSVIVDENDNVIEQIQSLENREIVELSETPDYLENAFIAIEDQRFRSHVGIDPKRIVGSFIYNIKVGDLRASGGSTITQQLAKNLYLKNEKKLDRKIKEAYLAIEIERKLTKNQILEYYLNKIPLGQSTFGIQSAAYTYFSKDVSELTLAESALLASIPKSTTKYSPYHRIESSEDFDIPEDEKVGYVYVAGTKYTCVYNETAVERQKTVLAKMLELEFITEEEYNEALSQDIKASLKPGQSKIKGISSHFTDYVKQQVVEDLMKEFNYNYEEAENYLFTAGLKIYATMDIDIQHKLEDSYDNFGELLLGKVPDDDKPIVQEWKPFSWRKISGKSVSVGNLDSNKNVLNENGYVLYYKKDNILDDNNNIYLTKDEYEYDENGDLIITSNKFNLYTTVIDVVDYYTIENNNNLFSHNISGLNIGDNFEIINKKGIKGSFKIKKSYLDLKNDIIIDNGDSILIDNECFSTDINGIIQPQSATVIMDYHSGKIKALVGGRNIKKSKTFNRAISAARQPGSIIKPLSVYLPALDNGYTATSVIDDIPRYDSKGNRWPKNWYENRFYKYWGLTTLRKSVEYSLNVNAVKMLEMIGLPLSQEYLAKLHLIDEENYENDNFITREENNAYNDETLASLALGGLTKGFTPLDMTAAYGAIANNGVYTEPICYTKVINSDGKVILEKTPEKNVVVTPQVAFILKDILRTTVTQGLSYNAKLPSEMGIEVAGKTGTTQDNGDIWFMGFSPYYVGGIWIGNDNSQLKLSEGSGSTARFWGNIMEKVHEGLPPSEFEQVEGIVKVAVCTQSGNLPTELCKLDPRGSQVRDEYFVKGTQPTDHCEVHVKASICTASNMLSSQYCPPDQVEERVFITRKTPYIPEDNPYIKNNNFEFIKESKKLYEQIIEEIQDSPEGIPQSTLEAVYGNAIEFNNGQISKVNGISVDKFNYTELVPEDYQYTLPTETCNWHNQWHWYRWLSEQTSTGQGLDGNIFDNENPSNSNNEDEGNENNNEIEFEIITN